MRRTVWILGLLLLVLLCGCQNAAEMEWTISLPEPYEALEAQPEAVSYPMATTETISILVPGEEGTYSLLERAQDYIGIEAEYTFVSWGELSAAISQMVESGDFTDLFYGHSMISVYTFLDYGDEIALDMTDTITRCAPNYLAAIRDDPVLSQVAFNGEYGEMFSFFQIQDGDTYPTYGPYVRGDWLEALGLDLPETYDDYHEILTAFRDSYGCTQALALPYTGAVSGDYLAAGYGVTAYTGGGDMATVGFYLEDGQVKYGPAEPGFYDYLSMLRQWYEEGLFTSDFVTWSDTNEYHRLVRDSETGLFYTNRTQAAGLEGNIIGGGTLVPIADAVQQAGDELHLGNQGNASTVSETFSVFAGSEHADLCVRWCDFWYSELGTQLVNYGTDGDIAPEEVNMADRCTLLPGIYDQTLYYQWMDEPTRLAVDTWSTRRDNTARLPSDLVLSETDQARFAVLAQGLTTAVTVYTTKVIVGEERLDNYQAFLQQLEEYGLQKCLDCLNTYMAQQ